MHHFTRDDIFDHVQTVVDFQFDERTVAVFPDMIHRSIPGYAALLQMTAVVGASFIPEHGKVYDLGCSLGGVSLSLQRMMPKSARIIAVDLSSAMVNRLRDYVQGAALTQIAVVEADITEMTLEKADVVTMNFVLQFIAPDQRDAVLANIYRCLPKGGALLIAEKICPDEPVMQQWHEAFKRSQGYSEMAVAQKRESLEHVMKTDTVAVVQTRLAQAGFQKIIPYFQGLSFKAWAAVK